MKNIVELNNQELDTVSGGDSAVSTGDAILSTGMVGATFLIMFTSVATGVGVCAFLGIIITKHRNEIEAILRSTKKELV